MKPWNAASSPVQATPKKSTLPAHCLLAASTEGASRLQMLQVGAQNQNATGRPATEVPSNSPPPTSGAVNSSSFGTVALTGDPGAVPVPDVASVDPQATIEIDASAATSKVAARVDRLFRPPMPRRFRTEGIMPGDPTEYARQRARRRRVPTTGRGTPAQSSRWRAATCQVEISRLTTRDPKALAVATVVR